MQPYLGSTLLWALPLTDVYVHEYLKKGLNIFVNLVGIYF